MMVYCNIDYWSLLVVILNDSNDNKCSAFEYNFSNNECTLRKECQQGTHLINSNNYTCDKGQIKNEEILLPPGKINDFKEESFEFILSICSSKFITPLEIDSYFSFF